MLLLPVKMEGMLRLTKSSLVCSVQFSQGFSRTIILSSIHSIIITDLLEVTLFCEDGSSVSLQGVVGGNAIENSLKTGLKELQMTL